MQYQEAIDTLTDAKAKLEAYRKAIGTSDPELVADINRRLVPLDNTIKSISGLASFVWFDASEGKLRTQVDGIKSSSGGWTHADIESAFKKNTLTISGNVYYVDQIVPQLHDLPTKAEWKQLKKEGWDTIAVWVKGVFDLNYRKELKAVVLETPKDAAQFKIVYM